MKKIRLANDAEYEIYHIAEANNILTIQMLNADTQEMQQVFSVPENLTTIQYFVGTDLIKGYAGYVQLESIVADPNQLISIDYSTPDPDAPSGFKEDRETIVTITLKKYTQLEELAIQVAENTANIDYLMMFLPGME